MWNKPSKAQLSRIPEIYATEEIETDDKIIHMHFFIGGCDWWVTEFDGENTFFGFVNLNNPQLAEWGYFTLNELDTININGIHVDRDLHWQPKKFSAI